MRVDLAVIEKALRSLQCALDPPPRNDRERDGAIQRFEYTFELAWKVGKKILEEHGIVSTSPKSVIRDLAQQGWIDNAEIWMEFLRARNATSHIYLEDTAKDVFGSAALFAGECKRLVDVWKGL